MTGCVVRVSGLLVAFVALLIVGAGCHQNDPNREPPKDLPAGSASLPNPDFLRGSRWVNTSGEAAFRELEILEKGFVVVRIAGGESAAALGLAPGSHRLSLTLPTRGQRVLSGYPLSVSSPRALWFTDSVRDPGVAQLALLLPLEAEQTVFFELVFGEPAGTGPRYLVLLGSYIRGLDTMEWDVYAPRAKGDGTAELRVLSREYFRGQFVFRRAN